MTPAIGETYRLDDGSAEQAAGLGGSADFMWLNAFQVIPGHETLTSISTAWGAPGSLSGTTPGVAARVFVYEDPDDDGLPDDAVKIFETTTTIENPDTDLFQRIPITPTVVSGWFFVAVAVHTPSPMYTAPWDGNSDEGHSWFVAQVAGINTDDLTDNEYPVQTTQQMGASGNWLLRAGTGLLDADGDGVLDTDDYCPGTVIPESVPTVGLEPNRFALVTPNQRFDTIKNGVLTRGPNGFTTTTTGGCSCQQIIHNTNAGAKHLKYGCERDLMRQWIAFVSTRPRVSSGLGEPEPASAANLTDWYQEAKDLPTSFALEGNYPNPFNPVTTIRFDMPEAARVHLSVFDVMGREVRVLVQGTLEAGRHEASFDGAGLPSGTYLYRLTTPTGVFSKTMVLLK